MSPSKKRKSKKKKKKGSSFNLTTLLPFFLLLCVLALLNSIQARREIIRIYNKYSIYFSTNGFKSYMLTNNFDTEIPKGYSVHGVDVSRYQGKIDWKQVAKIRQDTLCISFAFIKATQGKTYSDRFYSYNMKEARENNIICGAYHYYEPDLNSEKQAENFISLVELKVGDLPPVLDIEEQSPYGQDNMVRGIKNWLEIVEKHYGIKPIIYTSNCFHKDFLSGEEFKKYPFWIAHYYEKKLKTSSNWIFWQHTDKAHVNGISAYVDLSVFNGNLEELRDLCKKE